MATVTRPLAAEDVWATRKPRSLWGDAWRQFRRHRMAMAGLVVFVFLALASVFGPSVYTADPREIDYLSFQQGPSVAHPFGTDNLGRDMLARSLVGGRISIAVGVAAMLVAITVGALVGALSGFFSKADGPLMRLTDLFLAVPPLPVLMLVIFLFRDPLRAAMGPVAGIFVLTVVVIGLLTWMPVARLVRAAFLSLKQRDFVVAARSVGVRDTGLIFRHILPNAMSPILVAGTLAVGAAIITESALSFLGLGFPPDEPTWGRLLFEAQLYLDFAPHMAIFPGLLIFLAVISINYVGDGLRDALDPRKTG
ncbi:MAG TPA: ABC transporter permease [Candidatus Limnocylindria bacterium]|nr:ABC transporter permease [Candidatus Limnocylindria bacterium]